MPKTLKRANNQKRKTQKGGIFNFLRKKFRKTPEKTPETYEEHIINVINEEFLKKQMKNYLSILDENIEKEKNKVHLRESKKLKKFTEAVSKESTKLRILQKELHEKSKKINNMIAEIEEKKNDAVKIFEKKKEIIMVFAMAIQYKTDVDLDNELLSIIKNDKNLLLLKNQIDKYLDNLSQEEKIKKRKNELLDRELDLAEKLFGEKKRPEYYSTPLSIYDNSIDKEILRKQQKLNKTPIDKKRDKPWPISGLLSEDDKRDQILEEMLGQEEIDTPVNDEIRLN